MEVAQERLSSVLGFAKILLFSMLNFGNLLWKFISFVYVQFSFKWGVLKTESHLNSAIPKINLCQIFWFLFTYFEDSVFPLFCLCHSKNCREWTYLISPIVFWHVFMYSGSSAWLWSCGPVARTESWSNQSLQLGYRSMLYWIIPACLWMFQSHCNCVWKQVLINLLIYSFKCKENWWFGLCCKELLVTLLRYILSDSSWGLCHSCFCDSENKVMCLVEDALTICIFEICEICSGR